MITPIVNKPIRRRHQPNTVPSLSSSLLHYFVMWRKKLENYYKETNKKMCRYLTVLKIMKFMFNRKKVGLKEIIEEFNISRRMALYYMEDLQTIGLVFSKTGRKGYYYIDEDFIMPEKTVQSKSEANPPNPPHKDNIYIYNNNYSHGGTNFISNKKEKKKLPRMFIKICNKPNSINKFETVAFEKYDGRLKYNIVYADGATGVIYDSSVVFYFTKKLNIKPEEVEEHINRFCNWLFYNDTHRRLALKCFQNLIGLFYDFIKKDIPRLKEYKQRLRKIIEENKRRKAEWDEDREYDEIKRRHFVSSSQIMSLGEILNSSFGSDIDTGRSCVSLKRQSACKTKI